MTDKHIVSFRLESLLRDKVENPSLHRQKIRGGKKPHNGRPKSTSSNLHVSKRIKDPFSLINQ